MKIGKKRMLSEISNDAAPTPLLSGMLTKGKEFTQTKLFGGSFFSDKSTSDGKENQLITPPILSMEPQLMGNNTSNQQLVDIMDYEALKQ